MTTSSNVAPAAAAGADTGSHHAPARFAIDARLVAVVLIGMLATLAWGLALVHDVLPGTEVRYFLLHHLELPLERMILFPHLAYGDTRYTAMAAFEIVGRVCGRDITCVNTAGVGLTAIAVGLLIIHTARLLRSPWLAGLVALLWVASGPILNIWLWPSTWSDLVAFILLMVVGGFWWWALARPRYRLPGAIAFVVVSWVLLVLAFSAKELLWVLVFILPLLAIARSPVDAIRRNLALIAVPVLWACWYIGFALLNVDPGYSRTVGSNSIPQGITELLSVALSVSQEFMSMNPPTAGKETLRGSAIDLYLLFLVFAGAAVLWGARTWRRPDRTDGWRATLVSFARRWSVELYTGSLLALTVVIAARSNNINAYYATIPLWAGLTLTIAVLRRLRATWIVVLLAAGLLVGYVGLLRPGAVAPSVLQASADLRATGATIASLLRGRDVKHVTWQTDGTPFAEFYLIRDNSKPSPWQAGPDLFFWLVGLRPWIGVTDLAEGTAESIAADLSPYATPGEAVVVIDDTYHLALLAFEGEVIYQRPAPAPAATPTPAASPSASPSASAAPARTTAPTPVPSVAPSGS